MAQLSRAWRTGMALGAVLFVCACGRSEDEEIGASAAPVRHVASVLAQRRAWTPGKCLCVGHFREDAVEDFPAGVLDAEFARYPWLKKWSACAPYYGRAKDLKGCEGGMTDFICSISEKAESSSGALRVLCHVNGESESLRREGYLQDEYDVTRGDDGYRVTPVSLKGTHRIHE